MATKHKKRLSTSLTTVTAFSKTVALILFILLPFIGFYIGMRYQKSLDIASGYVPAPYVHMQAR